MTEQSDDLETVRKVVEALTKFEAKDQERIIRWSREKLGLPALAPESPSQERQASKESLGSGQATPSTHDIRTFVASKNPTPDTHFAATVAYYYKFEAPEAQRKTSISSEDLQQACRQVGRQRLDNPGRTLRDAHKTGLLDKGTERGTFVINTVGENLVALTLPAAGGQTKPRRKGRASASKRPASN